MVTRCTGDAPYLSARPAHDRGRPEAGSAGARFFVQLPGAAPSISIVTVMFQRRSSGTAPVGATTTR